MALRVFLRHGSLTNAAMSTLLRRDFPDGVRTWDTVQNRALACSGLQVTPYMYCMRLHCLLHKPGPNSDLLPCHHADCADLAGMGSAVTSLDYINLWPRLEALLQSDVYGPILISYTKIIFSDQEDGILRDFYSGSCFQSYAPTLEQHDHCGRPVVNLFLFVSTDGAPSYRSNTDSFWPIVIIIGSVPPHLRYKRKLVLPVLCIPGNPSDLESFMEPLFHELEALKKGRLATTFDGKSVLVRCHLMHEMTDLPAKKKMFQLKGVNSYHPLSILYGQGGTKEINWNVVLSSLHI